MRARGNGDIWGQSKTMKQTFVLGFPLWMAFSLCSGDLFAKCVTLSVETRGHIQCSFKPGSKILVTLIFAKNQPEGSGSEAALDIQDDSFKGRVAFDTFTSYNALTGHKCNRRPMSVIVRLTSAEGAEYDRKVLKFPADFDYDEKDGQYTIHSDITLHGWCETKCSERDPSPCQKAH